MVMDLIKVTNQDSGAEHYLLMKMSLFSQKEFLHFVKKMIAVLHGKSILKILDMIEIKKHDIFIKMPG